MDEAARHQAVLAEIDRHGRVEVRTLADSYQVSEVTIRKDLDLLEKQGMIRRVRGGAVSVSTAEEGAFGTRLGYSVEAKRAIARQAAQLVGPGEAIVLDASTTSYYLAEELLSVRDLLVITNGLRTADLLTNRSRATVLVPGGRARRAAHSVVDLVPDMFTGHGRIDRGFFGARAVSPELGLLDLAPAEAAAKVHLAAACGQVYGLVDSSKTWRSGLIPFAPVSAISALYTDTDFDHDALDQWRHTEVPVIQVLPVPEADL